MGGFVEDAVSQAGPLAHLVEVFAVVSFSPNFTRFPAKLLIFLNTAPFCSHNTSLIFVLTLAWVRESCESTETKSTLEHRTLHTRKPLPKIVVSIRLDNRVIRIAYVVSG
jgi:hypothetical protein